MLWLNVIVMPASIYLMLVAACIANRMSRRTKHRKRLTVIGLGGIGVWAIARSITWQWHGTTTDIFLAALVMFCAVILACYPRIKV